MAKTNIKSYSVIHKQTGTVMMNNMSFDDAVLYQEALGDEYKIV